MKDNFVHLHTHYVYSNFRLLDSTIKIDSAISHVANELKQSALAITDHECLAGHVEFLSVIDELKKDGKIPLEFKAILGNEIYLVDSEVEETMNENGSVKFYHFLLLAKNKEGHRQLRELSSRAWSRMRSFKGMERTPTYYSDIEDIVYPSKGNLIASTACLGSRFATLVSKYAVLKEDIERGYEMLLDEPVPYTEAEISGMEDDCESLRNDIHSFITWCLDMFGDDFYIEFQPSLPSEDGTMTDQERYNRMAYNIAKAYDIKPVVTTDAHYMTVEDRKVHEAFLTSDDDESGNREVASFYGTAHFFTSDELYEYLQYLGHDFVEEMIENTNNIANQVEHYTLENHQEIPRVPLPSNESRWYRDEGLTQKMMKYPNIKTMIESDEIYDRRLISLIQKGFKTRNVGSDWVERKLERVDIECGEIIGISKAKGVAMSSYFITMAKIIDIIWDGAQSIVGVSRGSGAGYEINYLLGITQISPLEQGIEMPHWRFISAERPDYPDIDIDIPSHKRDHVLRCLREYFQSFGSDIIRVSTVKKESSKSAIQTAVRGLGINNDTGTYLSSLIPIERGQVWSLEDVYYGNEEKGRSRVTEFVNQIEQFEGLFETALGVQNLISGRGVHACGVLILEDVNDRNCLMRAPNGEIIAQWNLQDSEKAGNIKYDLLNTKTMGMIQLTIEMLIENKHMEWQGSLRETYDKYLLPCNIDKDSTEMWDKFKRGEVLSAFQFETPVGGQAVKLIQPSSLLETASANTLMRLMVEEGEQPIDMYIRYKNDISEWYKDMRDYGLDEHEIAILEEHLAHDYGVCNTQESMMLLSMDSRISNFNVVEANLLRKAVAKKKGEMYNKAHGLFYKKGVENGCREIFLNYVWEVQIALQKGYSFSILHSIGYTWILIQQLNLVHHYPSIYWNTAVLLIESGAIEQEADEDDNKKEKTTNYGVVASAISALQASGVNIALPDINVADVGFIPSEATNSILFGLKGVTNINNDTARTIIENRPYTSLLDFHNRLVEVKKEVVSSDGSIKNKSLCSTSQTISLIKAGAFDKLEEGKTREQIIEDYLKFLYPPKTTLNGQNIDKVVELGIVPSEMKQYVAHYNFRAFINSLTKYQDPNTKSLKWIIIDCGCDEELTDYTTNYLFEHFGEMAEGRDYIYGDDGYVHVAGGVKRKGSFEWLYTEKMKPFMVWLSSDECVDLYNHILFSDKKHTYMSGNIARWEMESMNYYYTKHELSDVDKDLYSINNFFELSEEPTVVGFTQHKGVQYPKFQLYRICGTVLDRDKNKHTVTILTEHGVVPVKFYAGQFSFYDKTLSVLNDETGKKTKYEDSWFKRGNRLIVTGFRRGDQMRPKRYANSIYQHSLSLIKEVYEDGSLELQHDRAVL